MRPSLAALAVALPLALACGGGGAPDLQNTNTWSGGGVQFEYPGNWTLESETDVVDGVLMNGVTVQSADSGLLTVYTFGEEMDFTAEGFADDLMVEMPAQIQALAGSTFSYSQGPSSTNTRVFLGDMRTGARRTFTLGMFGYDAPHTLDVYSVYAGNQHAILFHQWMDEEADVHRPAFDLIFRTMKLD